MYTYAWYHWLTFFYLYCFFGWIFESTYVSLKERRFVNRGFLHLPMLPLYGTGAVMMLWVSLPVKGNLLLVYLSGVIAATILEYITGYVMERLFKIRYWDYSYQRFNFNGYICLSSSIAWGVLTILMTEVIHRPIEQLVLGLQPFTETALLFIISILFTADTIKSTREALDLAHALEAVTKLRGELDELQLQLALLKAEAAQNLRELRDAPHPVSPVSKLFRESRLRALHKARENKLLTLRNAPALGSHLLKGKLQMLKSASDAKLQMLRSASDTKLQMLKDVSDAKLQTRIELINKKLSEDTAYLQQLLDLRHRNILRRNPGISSSRFAAALKELKDTFNSHSSE